MSCINVSAFDTNNSKIYPEGHSITREIAA